MIEGAFGRKGHEFVTLVLLLTYRRHKQEYGEKVFRTKISDDGKLYLCIVFQHYLPPL